METLRVMVKNILTIIMLATFLEIILPRNDMKRYVNLIIGLFVIMAVLNPFLHLLQKDFAFDVFENTENESKETLALINKGKEFAAGEKAEAVSQYKQKLIRQITGLTGLYQRGKKAVVEIEMVENPSDNNLGQIKKIVVHLQDANIKKNTDPKNDETGKSDVRIKDISVTPVTDLNQPQTKPAQQNLELDLKNMLADFYGLTPDQIEIQK